MKANLLKSQNQSNFNLGVQLAPSSHRAGYRKKRPGPVNKTRPPSLKTNFSNILFNTAHNFLQSGFPNILNEKIS